MSHEERLAKLEAKLASVKEKVAGVPGATKEALASAKAEVEATAEKVGTDLEEAKNKISAETKAKAEETKEKVQAWLAEQNVEHLERRVARKADAVDGRLVVAAMAIDDVHEALLDLAEAEIDLGEARGCANGDHAGCAAWSPSAQPAGAAARASSSAAWSLASSSWLRFDWTIVPPNF